jgi:hypothetical protein
MKNIFLLLILVSPFVITSFSSCKHTQDVKCDTMSVFVYGVGPAFTGQDSVSTTRYMPDQAFDKPVDSAHYHIMNISADTFEVLPSQGQTQLAIGYSQIPAGFIVAGYDYKLVLKPSGKTYLITNVVSDGHTNEVFTYTIRPDEPFRCFTSIASCTINGISYTVTAISGTNIANAVYIQ